MYTLFIKDEGPDLDIVITRSMLALAALAAIVYRTGEHYYLNLLSAAALFMTALFTKLLLFKFRISKIVLLTLAAVVLFIATHSIAFAVILLLYGWLIKFLNKKPSIEVTPQGVAIKKLFAGPTHKWSEFSNIILKDGLLTLDFKNNKLMQVALDEASSTVDEKAFNDFCRGFM